MEDWQFEHINKNLAELMEKTTCSKDLLEELGHQKVLDKTDIHTIGKEIWENGEAAQKGKLFAMLQVRTNAFEGLLSALRKTGQDEALKILEGGKRPDKKKKRLSVIFRNTLLPVSVTTTPSLSKSTSNTKKNEEVSFIDTAEQNISPFSGNKSNSCRVHFWNFVTSGFTTAFIVVYLCYYVNIDLHLSIGVASILGIAIFLTSLKVKCIRATFLLLTPELSARTIRILVVHILMVLSPLQHLQSNSEIFFNSVICTTEKAMDVAGVTSGLILDDAMGGVKASVKTVNSISDVLERVISEPLEKAFAIPTEGIEKALEGISNLEKTCNDATSGLTSACQTILKIPNGICNGHRRKRSIGDFFNNIKETVGNGIGQATSVFQTGIGHVTQGVEDGIGHVTGGVEDGIDYAQKAVNDAKKGICDPMRTLSTECGKVQNGVTGSVCEGIGRVIDAKDEVARFRKEAMDKATSEFRFRVVANHNSSSSVNDNGTLSSVKESFRENVRTKLDFMLAFKRIWSMILALSIVYLVISKAMLVRKYVKNNGKITIKCKPVSIFFLITNPFTLQLCFLFLIGTIQLSFYLIHGIFQESILSEPIQVGLDFEASTQTTGGPTGKKIAEAIIETFVVKKEVNSEVNFQDCFQEQVEPPELASYAIAVAVSALGILTYVVDFSSRKRQAQMLQFVY